MVIRSLAPGRRLGAGTAGIGRRPDVVTRGGCPRCPLACSCASGSRPRPGRAVRTGLEPTAERWTSVASARVDGGATATALPLGALPSFERVGREVPAGGGPAPEPTRATTYTVQSGDSLYAIAAHLLGDAGRWGELYEWNRDLIGPNPSLIRPGMVLFTPGEAPSAEPAPEPPAEPPAAAGPAPEAPAEPPAAAESEAFATYAVQPGDTLGGIALAVLGDAGRWPELYDLNRAVIGPNPGMIRPGMVLALPGGPAPAPASRPPGRPPESPADGTPGADIALEWQAGQLAAGNSWAYWCLAFVNRAYQQAGRVIAELQAPSAADSMDRYAAQGRLNAWDPANPPPRGAVVFWGRTSWNPYGHVAISNGDGTVSTSGWNGFGGNAAISFDDLNARLARKPAGWAIP